MTPIHDLGYSVLFSNKLILKQLLETFVKQPWVSDIDFDQLEKLNKSFISEEHRKHESDLIYKVKLKKKAAYIIVLIEFQSKVQRFMAVRVLHYMMSFYLDIIRQQPRIKKLPPIFPIVLYNGDAKWTAPIEIQELIENHHLLGEFCLQFKYFKIVENEFSPESLLNIRNLVSTIFLAETNYNIDILSQELIHLFRTEDRDAVSLLLNWFKYLYTEHEISEEDFSQLQKIYQNEGEVGMLIKAIREEKRQAHIQGKFEGIAQGKFEGIALGEQKGRLGEKQAIAKAMLEKGLKIELIVEITQLSKQDIEKLMK